MERESGTHMRSVELAALETQLMDPLNLLLKEDEVEAGKLIRCMVDGQRCVDQINHVKDDIRKLRRRRAIARRTREPSPSLKPSSRLPTSGTSLRWTGASEVLELIGSSTSLDEAKLQTQDVQDGVDALMWQDCEVLWLANTTVR
ncbi:hypothetical protein A0H81_13958 [Grifola frondosa]|uniref:Uncharacterized protein n=1 Tax=Grifola frondosa TaxID=5627 RepID=A0A1C7LTH3_GRIFR|nr:hypothetical protein A0H81_13958 [Grifola frondosa]